MNNSNNKVIGGRKGMYELNDGYKIISLGEVISIDDPNGLGRIKVRIKGSQSRGGDDGILDNDLPWCFPLLPKFISTKPKTKEAVYVFNFGKDKQHADRLFLGPIISQLDKLDFDPFYVSALDGFSFGSESPNVSLDTIPELKGVFPDPNDVSIQGRYNTDIIQSKNQVLIRAGKFEISEKNKKNPYPFKFNNKTQAYIKIDNDVTIDSKNKGTITTIVSNKINLLTHKDGSPRFNLTNQENLISDEEMSKILKEAHPLVFGDVLLEYLRLLKDAFLTHVHNGNTPTDLVGAGNKQSVDQFKKKSDDLEKTMLSMNIKIN